MKQLYALVPVRVIVRNTSTEEVLRARNLVNSIVKNWQQTCVGDWEDNGAEKGSNATKVQEQPSYLFEALPADPITILDDEGALHEHNE